MHGGTRPRYKTPRSRPGSWPVLSCRSFDIFEQIVPQAPVVFWIHLGFQRSEFRDHGRRRAGGLLGGRFVDNTGSLSRPIAGSQPSEPAAASCFLVVEHAASSTAGRP